MTTSSEPKAERRLAAVMAVDVVGYSRLMGRDEAGTLARLKERRKQAAEPAIARHGGRIVKLMGDGALVEFSSAVEAVAAAIDIQRDMAERNAVLPDDERIEFRIGINLGDIVIEPDGEIYGDGVNIAARIEGLAEPGGIALARNIKNQLRGKLDVAIAPLGAQRLKNIDEPVEVWRVEMGAAATRARKRLALPLKPALAAAAGLIVVVAVIAVWSLWPHLTTGRAAGPTRGIVPDLPSLAILAFDNLSDDRDQGFLADGIAEDIITELARNRDLTIMARNTSFSFKGKGLKAGEIGRQLGVKYVLEGSVRKAGDRLRLTAQLIDSTSGQHVWAERYDVPATEIIEAQDRIIKRIAGTLFSHMREAEKAGALRRPISNFDAYELTLRGIAHRYRFTKEAFLAARKDLDRAIELDPTYAPAYAHLAALNASDAASAITGALTLDDLPAAIATARRAVALDPDLPGAYSYLSFGLQVAGEIDEALATARKAVELGPNDAYNLVVLANAEKMAGNYTRAAEIMNRAVALNPLRPVHYYAFEASIFYALDEFERLLPVTKECLAKNPVYVPCRIMEMVALMALGRRDEARQHVEPILKARPKYNVRVALNLWKYPRSPDLTKRFADHLRAAGLPDAPAATN
jgi:adenylate cyclase